MSAKERKQHDEDSDRATISSSSSSSTSSDTIHDDSEFRKIYLAAIEYGLSLLGKELGNATLTYLRARYDMSIDQTFQNPKLLYLAFENTLGFSSITVEKRIIRSLYSQIGYVGDNVPRIIVRLGHADDFVNSIQEAKKAFAAKKSVR